MPRAVIANRARVVRAGPGPRKIARISWKARGVWFRQPIRMLQRSRLGRAFRRLYQPQTEEAKKQLRRRRG